MSGPSVKRAKPDPCIFNMQPPFVDRRKALKSRIQELIGPLAEFFEETGIPWFDWVYRDEVEQLRSWLSPQLYSALSELIMLQDELVHLYFRFMEEAAIYFEIASFDFAAIPVYRLAMASPSLRSRELAEYAESHSGSIKYFLTLQTEVSANLQATKALHEYVGMAQRIRSDSNAAAFIADILRNAENAKGFSAFLALCVPSGTGKTQMAFCMPPESLVVYLNAAYRKSDTDFPSGQPIYMNFMRYFWLIWQKLDEDMLRPTQVKFWIYGFVKALMMLIENTPELNLPQDMSKIRVTTTPSPGDISIKPTDVEEARAAVTRVENSLNKKIMFFVDEFTALHDGEHKKLAFMRRKLINLEAHVVVASTDSGALNMLNIDSATPASRSGESPWVVVCTHLPQYVPSSALLAMVNACSLPGIKAFLLLCLRSRPLFAAAVVRHIQEFFSGRILKNSVICLVDKIREAVDQAVRRKLSVLSLHGCYGYIVAMLSAGYCRRSADDVYMRLLASLTTKNWAYLVNERILTQKRQQGQSRKKRQTQISAPVVETTAESLGEDEIIRVDLTRRDAIFLPLYRSERAVGVGEDDLFFGPKGSASEKFKCSSYFPDPVDDILLYLVLAGSPSQPGLYLADGQANRRISASKLIDTVWDKLPIALPSVNAVSPHSALAEMRVCAAFMTASNCGAIQGCSLEVFITRFVAELLISPSEDYVVLGTLAKIDWNVDFQVQFMWPFDTEVPVEVNKALHCVESTRPANRLMFDAATLERTSKGRKFKVIVEVKATIDASYVRGRVQAALERQDSNALVSFVVVEGSINHLADFDLQDLRSIDRGDGVSGRFSPGDRLSSTRLFKVIIDPKKSVILLPLDGKPLSCRTATRLIFLISLPDLTVQVNKTETVAR